MSIIHGPLGILLKRYISKLSNQKEEEGVVPGSSITQVLHTCLPGMQGAWEHLLWEEIMLSTGWGKRKNGFLTQSLSPKNISVIRLSEHPLLVHFLPPEYLQTFIMGPKLLCVFDVNTAGRTRLSNTCNIDTSNRCCESFKDAWALK